MNPAQIIAASLIGAALVIAAWKFGEAALIRARSDAFSRWMEFEPDADDEPPEPTIH